MTEIAVSICCLVTACMSRPMSSEQAAKEKCAFCTSGEGGGNEGGGRGGGWSEGRLGGHLALMTA